MPTSKHSSFARDSVFKFAPSATVRKDPTEARAAEYRTSVRLTDEEVTWLDCRCCELRRGGWHSISRSTIIRAVLQAISEERHSMTGITNEQELVAAFRRAIEEPVS